MARPYSSTPRRAISAATPATGPMSRAGGSPARRRPSTQPSRARRAVPTSTDSRPAAVAPAMRPRTPRVKVQSQPSMYTGQAPARTRPDTARTLRGAASQIAIAEPTLQAIAIWKARV